MDVAKALQAICGAGKGHCWYCDRPLPAAEEAIRAGWDVQRISEEHVPSIILVCPTCLRQKAELGEEEFLSILSQSAFHTVP
jgi:hypothetical protein